VGGLLVDGHQPSLSKRARARLSRHLYFVEKHGPSAHAVARGFRTVGGLQAHLDGLLQYIRLVDEPLFNTWARRLAEVEWPKV